MNPKFKKAIIFSILAVALIAVFDILAANSGVFGSPEDYTNGYFVDGWWSLFLIINLLVISFVPVLYYFLVRKDKSETISLFFTSLVLWFTGLADIFYFIFQFKMIPATLPWLNHGAYHLVSSTMGLETVTRLSLLITAALGLVFVYFLNKYMEKIN
jgi:hypothetical protein